MHPNFTGPRLGLSVDRKGPRVGISPSTREVVDFFCIWRNGVVDQDDVKHMSFA